MVVRVTNKINVETSVHLHGGHTPSHADGFPTFYTDIGKDRDYFYPNTVPKEGNVLDYSEAVSTCWYHDHAMDLTGPNSYLGLAGFFLGFDDLETSLMGKVLPASTHDIPMIFCDKRFNPDGTLFYDMLDHDGFLGDVFTVNGKVQPKMSVAKRKYRFRLCNGSNARFYQFRLSDGSPFLQVGKDAWLLPFAMQRNTLTLAPGQRADIIIDFSKAPKTLFFENILEQTDGRKPDGLAQRPVPLVRFDVGGKAISGDVSIASGTALRPHIPIDESEIVQTRTFDLGRSNGAWTINNLLYDPNRIDASIKLGTAERWIFKTGGGWWHPMHIHLESHQVQSINGAPPPLWESFKSDTTILRDSEEVEIFMKFRTFKGPFVFHCHNMEHEDMRMMMNFATV
jgi:FtsP/CotA-like multicopper oxidase with cupredoxin domain